MKNLSKVLLIGAVALATAGSLNQARAYYYDRYPDGYWDRDGHWQHYYIYHHHRGYWDQRNGVRVFINL